MKSTAPALSGGLALLRTLGEGPSTLDGLALATSTPKATALRLLRTLAGEGLVIQEGDRRWRALAGITSHEGSERARFRAVLGNLATLSGRIAEGYLVEGPVAQLADRREPPGCEVSLKAGLGFMRDTSEAEAVAQWLLLNGVPRSKHWVYRHRQPTPLTTTALKALLVAARSAGVSADPEMNLNGVRRCAAPIHREGQLTAVVALACVGGWRDDEWPGLARALREAASRLTTAAAKA